MNYGLLKDWELAREVFYAANPNTKLKYSKVRSEILNSVKVQSFNGEDYEVISIHDFDFIMPIMIKHSIGYEHTRGDDYSPDLFKAYCTDDNGFHCFVTKDQSVSRALAICYLKLSEILKIRFGTNWNA